MTEQVIFAADDQYDPAVQYYSLPTSCIGGGPNLHAARASYRSALADALGVGRRQLPTIVEHIEVPVGDNLWVRSTLDARTQERNRVSSLTREALRLIDDVTRKELHQVVSATGSSVLVVMLNDERMAQILDQMSVHDALWMVIPREFGIGWTALYKPQADGLQASDNRELDANEIRSLTVADFIRDIVEVYNESTDIEVDANGQTRRVSRSAKAPRPSLVLVG